MGFSCLANRLALETSCLIRQSIRQNVSSGEGIFHPDVLGLSLMDGSPCERQTGAKRAAQKGRHKKGGTKRAAQKGRHKKGGTKRAAQKDRREKSGTKRAARKERHEKSGTKRPAGKASADKRLLLTKGFG